MELDLWWLLLLPVVFAAGWLISRLDIRQRLRDQRSLPDSYFRGLNFLLKEQPDRAIDAFIEVAQLDPETIELHLALGSLFRRRGEIDRAMRVHQSLLQRADLPRAMREQAMLELAQDGLKAGLLDRAELACNALIDTAHRAEALDLLLRIHEMQRDWERALAVYELLNPDWVEQGSRGSRPLHLRYERVQQLLDQSDPDLEQARALLLRGQTQGRGRDIDTQHPRAVLLWSRLHTLAGEVEEAGVVLRNGLHDCPEYAGLIGSSWVKWLQGQFKEDWMDRAREELLPAFDRSPSLDLFDLILCCWPSDAEPARQWALAAATRLRSPLALIRLLEHQRAPLDMSASDLVGVLKPQAARNDRYVCTACGFRAKQLHWQCPGCNAWETFPPRKQEELQR